MVFARWRQLGPPESSTQTAFRLVQPFLQSSLQSVVGQARACPFPLKIAPWHGATWTHIYYTVDGSLDPPECSTQTASQSVQPFLHSSLQAQSVPILYNGPPLGLPPQNCPFCCVVYFLNAGENHQLHH